MRIGLALSGGAARGIAHVGVLKYLEEQGIKPCCIAGTSAGSIVGSFYASGFTPSEMEIIASEMSWKRMLRVSFPRKGLINSKRLLEMLEAYLGQITFDQLQIPLFVNAVDLVSGEEIVINEGIVIRAVAASCAIPGIFTPLRRENRLLVDGGLLDNIPVKHLRDADIDKIIAVNVGRERPLQKEPGNIFEILAQSSYIIRCQRDAQALEQTDILIEPDLGDIPFYDHSRVDLLVERGYQAAEKSLSGIDFSKSPGRLNRWLTRQKRRKKG